MVHGSQPATYDPRRHYDVDIIYNAVNQWTAMIGPLSICTHICRLPILADYQLPTIGKLRIIIPKKSIQFPNVDWMLAYYRRNQTGLGKSATKFVYFASIGGKLVNHRQ
jgi:hypothetical protein